MLSTGTCNKNFFDPNEFVLNRGLCGAIYSSTTWTEFCVHFRQRPSLPDHEYNYIGKNPPQTRFYSKDFLAVQLRCNRVHKANRRQPFINKNMIQSRGFPINTILTSNPVSKAATTGSTGIVEKCL